VRGLPRETPPGGLLGLRPGDDVKSGTSLREAADGGGDGGVGARPGDPAGQRLPHQVNGGDDGFRLERRGRGEPVLGVRGYAG
jgi:hypothetical protein